MRDPACRDMDINIFFGQTQQHIAQARAVCVGCPDRYECLSLAVHNHEPYGVWGGLSTRERRWLARLVRSAV